MTTPQIIQTIFEFVLLAAVLWATVKEKKLIEFEEKIINKRRVKK